MYYFFKPNADALSGNTLMLEEAPHVWFKKKNIYKVFINWLLNCNINTSSGYTAGSVNAAQEANHT